MSDKIDDKCKIEVALDRLERRIYSLNYDGYFTKIFFNEFYESFDLQAAFRVFFSGDVTHAGNDNKVHIYHLDLSVKGVQENAEKLSKLTKTDFENLYDRKNKWCIIEDASNSSLLPSTCGDSTARIIIPVYENEKSL